VLITPAVLPYLSHYLDAGNLHPTGFVQGDQAYYMANAREHFDRGAFSLTYGNPSGANFNTPPIYFQPQTLFLGIVWRYVYQDPGTVFVVFGLMWAIVCGRMAIMLFESLFGLSGLTQWICLTIMFWGGGILALTGLLVTGFYSLYGTPLTVQGIFYLDPFAGQWCLNFGRTLIYPNEAYYHALFFAVIILLLKRRYVLASVIALLLSFSHPFTGIELLAIVFGWILVELIVRKDPIPAMFVAGWSLLVVVHLGYYLYFLPLSPEHRALMSQWAQPWLLETANAIPAYVLVAVPAIWRIRTPRRWRETFSHTHNRLFLVWFVVAFTLANHELFMRAQQPLHFTRGYIWLPLFLLGVPVLLSWFRILQAHGRRLAKGLVCAVILLFFSDNALWFSAVSNSHLLSHVRLTADQGELLRWINTNSGHRTVVVSEDPTIGYLTTVYSPARAWLAHPFNTPEVSKRKEELENFFRRGEGIDMGMEGEVVIVFSHSSAAGQSRKVVMERVRAQRTIVGSLENAGFTAFKTVDHNHGFDHH